MVTHKVEQSVMEIVDALLAKAIMRGASDIHLESTKEGLRVRFRLDGMLYDQDLLDIAVMHQVISRIKVLAHIDIAQKRIPQDGKFQLYMHENQIDLRVSTFPTVHGQKMVIRILDPATKNIAIEYLGMPPQIITQFQTIMQKPQGFFLVTGPTGSGKTTTLYAGLSHINRQEKNIITLEDPIEYYIDGITQGHIHPESGFTFEKGMRALLRQDPDVVMIGEIRDQQTAQIAIQASMTGHLVLSTLHTNDAPSVIMRLMDMGIEPFLINASLTGVLAQRLARMLCADCKTKRLLNEDEVVWCAAMGYSLDMAHESKGCASCYNLGHKGRIGIFEQLIMSEKLRDLMQKQPSIDAIRAQAAKEGMRSLLHDGFDKVQTGLISLAELMRII